MVGASIARRWRCRAAHLVCDYRPAGCACVCCNDDAAVEQRTHNGRSCAGRLGQRHALGVEGGIAVVVGEVEAGHGGGVRRREGVDGLSGCRWWSAALGVCSALGRQSGRRQR